MIWDGFLVHITFYFNVALVKARTVSWKSLTTEKMGRKVSKSISFPWPANWLAVRMDRRVCFYRKITTHEITLLYPLTMSNKLRKHNTQKRSELLQFQHRVFHCQLSLSIHTSANSGGDDRRWLCFILLRYIINLSVRELIALKPLWEFTMGCSL